jgi:hypothetical protein
MLATNRTSKIQFEIEDPESGDADLFEIRKTAQTIREQMAKINAAERWVTIGGELAKLKTTLARSAGGHRAGGHKRPGDNERIGWRKAFELRILPLADCGFADKMIIVHEFFTRNNFPHSNLPVSCDALHILAIKFRDPELIKKLIADGRITAATRAREIRNLAHELGLLAKRVSAPVNRDSPKSRRIETVLKLVQRLNLTINDLKQGR